MLSFICGAELYRAAASESEYITLSDNSSELIFLPWYVPAAPWCKTASCWTHRVGIVIGEVIVFQVKAERGLMRGEDVLGTVRHRQCERTDRGGHRTNTPRREVTPQAHRIRLSGVYLVAEHIGIGSLVPRKLVRRCDTGHAQ